MLKRLAIIAVFSTLSQPALASDSTGAYNARLGDCTSCHTAPGHKPFAGGLAIHSPFGTIYSTNITPDKEYGIGDYSLKDFSRALREGIAKDGHRLYPAMPYPSFAGASDTDIATLYDYFMHEVAPVHEQPPQTKLPFPFNQRWGIRFWNMFFLYRGFFKPDPAQDAQWNRGAYLAQTLAHCGACHTPRGPFYEERGTPKSDEFLTGATLDHWHAPNLRGAAVSGLGKWSEDDIAAFLKIGHATGADAFGNMAQAVENSTQHLTDADRQALAHYLKSLSAYGEEAAYKPVSPPADNEAPGAGLYASSCASCHLPDGSGKSPRIPKLAGNPAILSADATSVIRIVLEGGQSLQGTKMPAFEKTLNDQEIADVVSYIRSSWGNRAQPVTGRDVETLHKALRNP